MKIIYLWVCELLEGLNRGKTDKHIIVVKKESPNKLSKKN